MDKEEYNAFINQDTSSIIANKIIKNYIITNRDDNYDPCKYCSNHPRNGGSGICHCILGQSQITW